MEQKQINFSKKYLLFILKISIALISFIYIFRKIYNDKNLYNVLASLSDILTIRFNFFIAIIILLFVFANWSVEAIKWKMLISKIEKISFFKSLKSVLVGLSIGIITPSRVGEFGGKVFFLEKSDRKSAFMIAMLSSFSQLSATLLFGFCGLIFFTYRYYNIEPILFKIIIGSFCVFFLIVIWLFINISFFADSLKEKTYMQKIKKYLLVLNRFKTKEMVNAFMLSCLRFLIFTTQFLALLYLFNAQVDYFEGFLLISLSYLVLTIVPSIALADIGIRGTVSVYFIGFLTNNEVGILSASIMLWLLNLALPALVGVSFIYQLKFVRAKKTCR